MNNDNLFFLIACLLNIVLRKYLTTSFVFSLSEYLSMVFDDSSDLEEIPDESMCNARGSCVQARGRSAWEISRKQKVHVVLGR